MTPAQYQKLYPAIIGKFLDIQLTNGMLYTCFYFESKATNGPRGPGTYLVSAKGDLVDIQRIKTITFSK